MSQTHANTWSTHPTNRYKNGKQVYHFETPQSVTVVCNQDTFFMNKLPGLGICAGTVLVNGVPISIEGTLSIPQADWVSHAPNDTGRGVIEIRTQNTI